MIFSILQKNGFWGIVGTPYCGIGATIRIGQEMLCLPYAGFFHSIIYPTPPAIPPPQKKPKPSAEAISRLHGVPYLPVLLKLILEQKLLKVIKI